MTNKCLLWVHLRILCTEIVIQLDPKKKKKKAGLEAEQALLRDDVVDCHCIRDFPFIDNLPIF